MYVFKYNLASTYYALGIMQDTLQSISLLLLHLSKVVHSSLKSAATYMATDPHSNLVRKEVWVSLVPLPLGRIQIL